MASKVSEISRKRRTIFALRWSTVLRDWAFVTSPPLQAKHRAMLASQQAPAQVAAFGKGLCLRLRVAHIHGWRGGGYSSGASGRSEQRIASLSFQQLTHGVHQVSAFLEKRTNADRQCVTGNPQLMT